MKLIKSPLHNSGQLMNVSMANGRKILWAMGKHAFSVMLVLILMSVLYGEVLFYQHVFLASKKPLESSVTIATFKENVYTTVLAEQVAREQALQNSAGENYTSPF